MAMRVHLASMAQNLDDPEVKRRLVSQLLKFTPFIFIGCWLRSRAPPHLTAR
jgi:hypothetical protein